jgi:hypothetical protein
MILLVNPRATRPRNRRFPLSLMSVGAALPEGTDWEILDGNRPDVDLFAEIAARVKARAGGPDPVQAVAMTVMPGPQLVSAVPLARRLKERFPRLPIVWGGNFGSLYPAPVLNSPHVDWLVRGQGEHTFAELLEVLAGARDPKSVAGLAFRQEDGRHWIGPERHWVGPDELPDPPYHRIPVGEYLHPTFLGRRSGVYQSSIGCPYGCKFCGVISVLGSREKQQAPARTAEHLAFLARTHGMDSVHFYDNNFFVGEEHARELARRIEPLGLRWWCEARVDALLRFSDDSWRLLKRAGLTMVFCGAESGEPEREIENTLAFVRRLKSVNPAMELISYFYTPTPQRRGTYGNVDALAGTPATLEEWTEPEWVSWMTHEDPNVPWLDRRLKARVEDFQVVLRSRFPSVNDRRTRAWGRALGRLLARRRWEAGDFSDPRALRAVRRWAQAPMDDRQEYGHLRPALPRAS